MISKVNNSAPASLSYAPQRNSLTDSFDDYQFPEAATSVDFPLSNSVSTIIPGDRSKLGNPIA